MKTLLKEQTSLKYGKMVQLNKINYIFQIYETIGYIFTYSLTHYLCKGSKPVLARHLLNRNTELSGESLILFKIMGWKLLAHSFWLWLAIKKSSYHYPLPSVFLCPF